MCSPTNTHMQGGLFSNRTKAAPTEGTIFSGALQQATGQGGVIKDALEHDNPFVSKKYCTVATRYYTCQGVRYCGAKGPGGYSTRGQHTRAAITCLMTLSELIRSQLKKSNIYVRV